MPSPDLTALIGAIETRGQALAGSAAAKDVVFLAKAVEAMTGSVTQQAVRDEGADQVAAVQAEGTNQVAVLQSESAAAQAAVSALLADELLIVDLDVEPNPTLTSEQWGKRLLRLTGALAGDALVTVPDVVGARAFVNETTGGFVLYCKSAAQTVAAAVALPAGAWAILVNDGGLVSVISAEPFSDPLGLLTTTGDLLVRGSTGPDRLSVGVDGAVLRVAGGAPVWRAPDSRPGTRVASLPLHTHRQQTYHTNAFVMIDGTITVGGAGATYANGDTGGTNRPDPRTIAVDHVNPPNTPFVAVAQGNQCFFAITGDGEVFSWDYNGSGCLGHGDTTNRAVAKRIDWFADQGHQITRVFTPTSTYSQDPFIFFLTTTGLLFACGANSQGQLGDGTTIARTLPVAVGALSDIVDVSVGSQYQGFVLARDSAGQVFAWGYNSRGALGLGDTTSRSTPIPVPGIPAIADMRAQGGVYYTTGYHAYYWSALLDVNGRVWTAGYNGYGQLGHGDTTDRHDFTEIAGLPDVRAITTGGGYHGCAMAIDLADNAWAWGSNEHGQLALGDATHRHAPVQVVGEFQGNVGRVHRGGEWYYNYAILLDKDGRLWSAGYESTGHLARFGNPSPNNLFSPMAIGQAGPTSRIVDFKTAGSSSNHVTMALTEDGRVFSCGYAGNGASCLGHTNNISAMYAVRF